MNTSRKLSNIEISELLRDIAASYQLQDEKKNRFKIIAYQRASDAVEHATSELKDLWDDGKLKEIPGIGESIAEHLDELFKTGKVKHFDELTHDIPKSVFLLMKIPGIGIKTAFKLVKEFNIKSINDLKKAAQEGKIAKLEGFGEDSQASILKSVGDFEKKPPARNLMPYAQGIASEVIEWIKKDKNIIEVDPLGSLRRKAATVGDIDISAASSNSNETIEHFTKYPKASRVLEKGQRSASLILPGNIQVDLMVSDHKGYGSLLQHFTGSKHHNIALREYALKKGYSLSDYGIKKVKDKKQELKTFSSEKDLYKFLGMDYIEPELREDTGEIETALTHKLPKLIELSDIKGDLQMHSSFDIETSHDIGASTMEEHIQKGNELGYEYIAFTEHNPSRSKHTDDQIIEILKRKKSKVDELNYSLVKSKNNGKNDLHGSVKKVFNSLEIDIQTDGKLSIPDSGLEFLDFALVSIHSSFKLVRHEMTNRVIRALDHPKVKIFAHPTTRKLNEREGVELNWPQIFDFCKKNDKWIEINCEPTRLDLPDTLVREAVKFGVKLTFGTDAHQVNGMNNMQYGVYVARRGWATKDDIINTRSLKEFEEMISYKKTGGDI